MWKLFRTIEIQIFRVLLRAYVCYLFMYKKYLVIMTDYTHKIKLMRWEMRLILAELSKIFRIIASEKFLIFFQLGININWHIRQSKTFPKSCQNPKLFRWPISRFRTIYSSLGFRNTKLWSWKLLKEYNFIRKMALKKNFPLQSFVFLKPVNILEWNFQEGFPIEVPQKWSYFGWVCQLFNACHALFPKTLFFQKMT